MEFCRLSRSSSIVVEGNTTEHAAHALQETIPTKHISLVRLGSCSSALSIVRYLKRAWFTQVSTLLHTKQESVHVGQDPSIQDPQASPIIPTYYNSATTLSRRPHIMTPKHSNLSYPYNQPTALYAIFQGSLFFTATILSFDLESSKPGTWAIFGIICALVSFFSGLILLVYTRHRLRLSIWKVLLWALSTSGGASGIAILIFGSGSWASLAAILWGWLLGIGGVILVEWLEERREEEDLPEYVRI